ncbi:MAG: hypothetical protein KGD73_04755 [Candidatus Lokiarchaeota archaeon]|nr:hypothetical protein [Candidatus Lokiarchaeota archaeon]
MTDTRFGNGTKLAETLKGKFPDNYDVKIADVKEVSAEKVAEDVPDVIVLGGAVRMFMGDKKTIKWMKELNNCLKKSGKNIKYGTGFLTHALPTDKVQGYAKRFLEKINNTSAIEKTYSELLTARVEGQEGPILPEEMEKAINYAQSFITWCE